MKTASVKEIKEELGHYSKDGLVKICLRLSKFKKENKELLTYVLFEEFNELLYVQSIKDEIELEFLSVNTDSVFYAKKTVRKILRLIKRYSKYSKHKETEVDLLFCFCEQLSEILPLFRNGSVLHNIQERQKTSIKKLISKLHEDFQTDYENQWEEIFG